MAVSDPLMCCVCAHAYVCTCVHVCRWTVFFFTILLMYCMSPCCHLPSSVCTGTLAGMCESQGKITSSVEDEKAIEEAVLSVVNLGPVSEQSTGTVLRFAGVTFASQSVVLVTVETAEGNTSITVNCEKMTIHSILLKELKEALSQI